MKSEVFNWRTDKLKTTLIVFWLLTVFSSFFGDRLTLTYLPGVGALYLFRIFLPVTALLYIVWMIRAKHNPWKQASHILRLCYVLCIILVLYGGLSLLWAMDREFTFRRWFNLCFDLCFFFLALDLGRDKTVFQYTILCTLPAILMQIMFGIVDAFTGGIFYSDLDIYHGITFFGKACHWPMGTVGNPNDYSMMLLFVLALLLLYWAWRREEKCNWIPVVLIAPIYFLIRAGEARLCEAAFFVLLAGFILYALTLGRKKCWILIATILLLGFVKFGCDYQELMTGTDDNLLRVMESFAVSADAAPVEEEQRISISAAPPAANEFFVVDEETGELRANLHASGGIRLYLLMLAADCFIQSKGMGVGLGNTEQIAKLSEANIENGVWAIHCFLARMTADFGIWFLIPLLLIVFALLRTCFTNMLKGFREKNPSTVMMWVLYLTALIIYPIASTAPSEAQDALVMWIFLAGIVLFPMHMQNAEGK